MATNRVIPPPRGPQVALPGHHGNLEVVRVNTETWEAEFQVRAQDGKLTGPRFPTRLSMIRPLSDEDTRQFWTMLVEDLIARLKAEGRLPVFVKDYEILTGDDSSGDPALYVNILVKPPTRGIADNATVSKWNDFANLVEDSLLRLHLQRRPYVRLGEWRRKR